MCGSAWRQICYWETVQYRHCAWIFCWTESASRYRCDWVQDFFRCRPFEVCWYGCQRHSGGGWGRYIPWPSGSPSIYNQYIDPYGPRASCPATFPLPAGECRPVSTLQAFVIVFFGAFIKKKKLHCSSDCALRLQMPC